MFNIFSFKKLYHMDWSIRETKDQKEEDFLWLIGGIMDGSDRRVNSTVVWKAARRARDDMLAYSWIQERQEQQDCEEEHKNWEADKNSVTYALIEKVVKQIWKKNSPYTARLKYRFY